jgi:branched-chain amino acid transport system substrate-binding protein
MGAWVAPVSSSWAAEPVYIAFDGAYGVKTNTAPKAIERGILAAMEEINARGGVLGGRPLKLLTTDNQGVSARARDNYLELAAKPAVVAVLGGKFSPVTVETVPEAQRIKVPLVSVWGSADQITDNGHQPSYTFRLSLKDSWGVEAMLQRAATVHKAQRACAVLPNTSWGRSGHNIISSRAGRLGLTVVSTRWYNWGDKAFGETLAACRAGGAQVMVLVANEAEAALIVREMAALPLGRDGRRDARAGRRGAGKGGPAGHPDLHLRGQHAPAGPSAGRLAHEGRRACLAGADSQPRGLGPCL